jgi:hypothetical protein
MATRILAIVLSVIAVACDYRSPGNGAFPPVANNPTAPTGIVLPPPPQPGGERPVPGTGPTISSGETISGTVQPNDEQCFPTWDLTGVCRRFKLETGTGGLLRARLRWSPPHQMDVMDLFAVSPDLKWVVSFDGTREELIETRVEPGLVYDLLVMTYAGIPIAFELTAEIQK